MALLRRWAAWIVVPALLVSACGDDDTATAGDGPPDVVVTTNILGDVVSELVGDLAAVTTVMPVGANPHDFHASAQQVGTMTDADALIVNGAGFEEGLADAVRAVERDGVPTFEAVSAVSTIEFGGHGDDHEGDDDDGREDADGEDDDHDHAGGRVDPHFFTDPARMAEAVAGIADFLTGAVPTLDTGAFRDRVDDYVQRLEDLDAEVEEILGAIPADRRVLVTNHEVFGYFADRYGFEVVGTVIPGGSTNEGASAGDVAALARLIGAEGVPAIFAETSSPARLADTLAAEVGGDVEVVELFTESLGDDGSDGSTYLDMIRFDATQIADALA